MVDFLTKINFCFFHPMQTTAFKSCTCLSFAQHFNVFLLQLLRSHHHRPTRRRPEAAASPPQSPSGRSLTRRHAHAAALPRWHRQASVSAARAPSPIGIVAAAPPPRRLRLRLRSKPQDRPSHGTCDFVVKTEPLMTCRGAQSDKLQNGRYKKSHHSTSATEHL